MTTHISLKGIACQTIIGVFDWERRIKQKLLIDLSLEILIPHARNTDKIEDTVDYKGLTAHIIEVCKNRHCGLLERLVEELTEKVFGYDQRIVSSRITLHKQGALRQAHQVSIHFEKCSHQVVVGIGSNIKPAEHVKAAIEQLTQEFHIIKKADWLTTKAIARPKDPDFINTAVLLRTDLSKSSLVNRLKHIEYEFGRERNPKDAYAKRNIDLDILLWNDTVVDADLFSRDFLQQLIEQLTPGMLEHLRPAPPSPKNH